MARSVGVDQLAEAIEQELTIYSQEVTDKLKKQAKQSMNELVKATKADAPVGRRQKHYRDSITSKKESENARSVNYVWYVKGSDYRLSHLLENGHALKNGGRVEGTHFISKNTDQIIENYLKAVEEIVRNG